MWAALLAGIFGRYAWPLELLSHFRLQYALLFAGLTLVLALLGRRSLALLSLAGALLSAAPLGSYLAWPGQHANADTADRFRLVTFNVWMRNPDRAQLASYLEGTGADAIVLQELTTAQATELQGQLSSYPYAYLGAGSEGAVVFSRWPVLSAETIVFAPGATPAASLVLRWRGVPVRLLGVHLHWPLGGQNAGLRNAELSGIARFALSQPQPLLVAGDFNLSPWSPWFSGLIARSGLSHCGLGQGLYASWPAPLGGLGIAIDHCLASRHWRSLELSTGAALGSDHRPLIVDLALRDLAVNQRAAGAE